MQSFHLCRGFVAYCDEITCNSTSQEKTPWECLLKLLWKSLYWQKWLRIWDSSIFLRKQLNILAFGKKETWGLWSFFSPKRPLEGFKSQDIFQSINLKWVITIVSRFFWHFHLSRLQIYCFQYFGVIKQSDFEKPILFRRITLSWHIALDVWIMWSCAVVWNATYRIKGLVGVEHTVSK